MLNDQKNEDGFCVAVYNDDNFADNAMVMFMEYDAYGSVHAVMKEMHDLLSAELGYPVSMCHNSPADENVLIHGSEQDSRPFHMEECCKEDTIRCCMDFLQTRKGYRPEIQALALMAESIYERTEEESIQLLLERLNWNEDPLPQLIRKELGH